MTKGTSTYIESMRIIANSHHIPDILHNDDMKITRNNRGKRNISHIGDTMNILS